MSNFQHVEDPFVLSLVDGVLSGTKPTAPVMKRTDHRLTFEEKRAVVYNGVNLPTDASGISYDTPLTELNLNWTERDLPERERTKHVHRLHPYLGKYIPQLVEIFLRKFFRPGQAVLDPFSGSGTTAVQANELGINAVGYDISAFNILLGQVKTRFYNVPVLKQEMGDVMQKLRASLETQESQGVFWKENVVPFAPQTNNEYLKAWFAPQALCQLLTFKHYIDIGKYQYADLMRIIMCRSARSARLTTHFDLDFPKKPQIEPYYCYKHSRTCEPTKDAMKFIERYAVDSVARVADFARQRGHSTAQFFHADSRSVDTPPIDGVITSPPYVGLIDYHAQHAYAYNLLGLEDRRTKEIGAAAFGYSVKAKQKYQEDMIAVFANVIRRMPSGSPIIVVAGDKNNLYPSIADALDVVQESVVQRHVNRRTGRRSGEFFESIFIWRKR